MAKIRSLLAREILDSRGNPTLEVACWLESGVGAVASVPSGASTGAHEALELRDHDDRRFGGLGVTKAVENVNGEIAHVLQGKDLDQAGLDAALIVRDGTKNKARLGANAILGVSLAFARVVAHEKKQELFRYLATLGDNTTFKVSQPALNVINGGKHSDSGLDIQEYMIVPAGFDSFSRKIQAGAEIISALKKKLQEKGYGVSMGDEGGFAPKLSSNEEALEYITDAIVAAGYSASEVKIALDVAATSFYKDGGYEVKVKGLAGKKTSQELINWYQELAAIYPIISIEDGLAEDDWQGFSTLTAALGGTIQVVGDDLTVTNTERITKAAEQKAISAVLIKPNQIGTVTETVQAIALTKKQGWTPFVSHRSGETTDTFIADLAVGLGCNYIKAGSLARGERVCKYNRLLEIEQIINHT